MTKMEKRIENMNTEIEMMENAIKGIKKNIQSLLDQLNDDFSLDVAQRMSNESNKLATSIAELEGKKNQLEMMKIWAEEDAEMATTPASVARQ